MPDDFPQRVDRLHGAALRSGFADSVEKALAATSPEDADPTAVGHAVVAIVESPVCKRPLHVHIDPADDGAKVSFAVIDRVREQFLQRIGYTALLHPAVQLRGSG